MIGHRFHGHGPIRAVVLHGWFDDGSVFEPVLPALDPERFSIALMDYRGYGLSKGLPGPFSISAIAHDAARLASDLAWPDYAVIGHSMGGKAALRLAANHPDRVTKVLGITPVWAGPGLDAGGLGFFRTAISDLEARAAIVRQSTGGQLPEAWSRGVARRSELTSTVEAFGGYLESWALDDFAAEVRELPHEVLALAGANDGGIPAEAIQATWVAGLPKARMEVLASCGHYPMLETPLALAASIERFLAPA